MRRCSRLRDAARQDVPMRHITDDERRQRLARRHALARGHRHSDPLSATTGMTVLHATEAGSVYLALVARVHELDASDVDRALYDDRTLVKQLAMRRTLFVFPRDLLPAAWSSAGARTAEFERRKISKDLVASGRTTDGDAWLANARAAVLAALSAGPLSARQLRAAVPLIETTVTLAPGTRWGGDLPVAPRILAWMGARGDLVRGRNDGGWWVSRPVWTRMEDWLDGPTRHPGGQARRGGRISRADPPLAVDVRARNRDRHRLVAGWRPRLLCAGPSASWPLCRSPWTLVPLDGYCPTIWNRCRSTARGRRCCPRWTRRRWAGRSGTSTSTRMMCPSCSIPRATPERPPGSMGGSWGAGSRTTTPRCRSSCARRCRPRARVSWTQEARRLTCLARRADHLQRLHVAASPGFAAALSDSTPCAATDTWRAPAAARTGLRACCGGARSTARAVRPATPDGRRRPLRAR